MPTVEDILKADYEIIVELWKFENKWVKKSPLEYEDWEKINDESNEIAKKRQGKAQKILVAWINAVCDEIDFIDKNLKGAKNG